MSRERAAIAAMRGYTPGTQPATFGVTKLNTNENPYPPCAAVLEALGGVEPEHLRRYPPPTADALREVIARVHETEVDRVVAVNGGDELLRLAFTTFVDPGTAIGILDPSYSLVPVLAQIHGVPVVRAPCADDWSWPVDLAERMNAADVRLLFVVNPHAPSGHLTPVPRLEGLAHAFRGVLCVDEAYVDFVDPALDHDAVPVALAADNVLLLRTLSKGYSLAGLRIGYGVGHPALIAALMKTRDSYNVDAIAQRLARVALEHRAEAADTWRRVREERARLGAGLRALGCAVPESQSNFLLARMPLGHAADAAQRALEARGILVRWFDEPRLRDSLRVTVGTAEENDRLLLALGAILSA
jgi:histidinol-phosphate aminotransferase